MTTTGFFKIATPGSSKRLPWRVVYVPGADETLTAGECERYDKTGRRVVGYGTRDAAAVVANRLNASTAAPAPAIQMLGF